MFKRQYDKLVSIYPIRNFCLRDFKKALYAFKINFQFIQKDQRNVTISDFSRKIWYLDKTYTGLNNTIVIASSIANGDSFVIQGGQQYINCSDAKHLVTGQHHIQKISGLKIAGIVAAAITAFGLLITACTYLVRRSHTTYDHM